MERITLLPHELRGLYYYSPSVPSLDRRSPTHNGSSRETERLPHRIDALLHLVAHADGTAPFARSLAGPFVGCVEADLAAKPRDGRGEIEVVDGRVLRDQRVARRVHARGHGPGDVLPVAPVRVVVGHGHG